MPKRKTKLSRAYVESAQQIIITDWSRIEKVYGHNLSAAVRKEVLEATDRYVMFVPVESVAETVRAASHKVKRAQKAGLEFIAAVEGMNGPNHNSIVPGFFVFPHFGRAEKLNLFFEMIASFTEACRIALEEINAPSNHGAVKESSWRWWISELTQIAKRHGLPWQVRKDSDKSRTEKPSQFVAFVRELQSSIPCPYRPTRRENDALATAINRARGSGQQTDASVS
jgi:hypothetical protein